MQGYADSDTLTFSRRDRWKTAQLEWRGYAATDSMTKLEKLKNKNVEAIIKVYSEIAVHLMADMEDQFGDEFYIDGNAAGNSKRIHGVKSFLGTSGASTLAPIGKPNSTYAGLVATLGNYGGTWSGITGAEPAGTWPTGTGDAHFDFWSPLIVDYTSAVSVANGGWAATTKTWPNTCEEAIRFGLIKSRKNKSARGMIDLILLNDDLYRQFEDKFSAKERLNVQRGDKKGGLYALGFEDMINFEGCEISYEYGLPSTEGYGFPIEMMELASLQDQLFVPNGPDEDIASQSFRFSIDFFGNLQCRSIRNFMLLDNVT